MKTTKEIVYEFIQQEIYKTENQKIETKVISERLGMQRSNVSSLLNELVREGKLIKTNTRPVFYKIVENTNSEECLCFSDLIGYNDSLRNAIQLAKAAILYPRKSLHVLLQSKSGCGTTAFAYRMFKFASKRNIFDDTNNHIKINCRHYVQNIEAIDEIIFGKNHQLKNSAFAKIKKGMVFIDRFDLLNVKQQSAIFQILENGKIIFEEQSLDCSELMLVISCPPETGLALNRKFPVTIELPELKERSMIERFDLINHFFTIEAANSMRSIEVSAEVIQALLLTDFAFNIKEMEFEIKAACANAYVRVVNEEDRNIFVCLHDFKESIKRSLLRVKDHQEQLDVLLGRNEIVFYDLNKGYQGNYLGAENLYNKIANQYQELSSRGVNSNSIHHVINNHIHNLFESYSYGYEHTDKENLEKLAKIVDIRVIDLVRDWLQICKQELNREFKSNVFYGLCLHINSLLNQSSLHQRVKDEQVVMTIQNYPKEYACSERFGMILKREMNLNLPTDEIVLITMFLIEQENSNDEGHPVLCYIMHGKGTAKSLMEVTSSLTQCQNVYYYDLDLGKDSKTATEEIKKLLQQIDQGKGVIVIYDMGSIKTMIDMISEEIDIKIRYMNIPITLIGIDIARKCSMENDIDQVYHMARQGIQKLAAGKEERNPLIITLCNTGEGGAVQLKNYIDQYSKLHIKTVALCISDKEQLVKEVSNLNKTYDIHAFVGTYDPMLMGIPFIPISKIFESSKEFLDKVLMFEEVSALNYLDYQNINIHLEETLQHVSMPKLKKVMPDIMRELIDKFSLDENQMVGVYVHLACVVERLITGESSSKLNHPQLILEHYPEDMRMISKCLKRLEKAFKIIIDDNEIATLLLIVKKL